MEANQAKAFEDKASYSAPQNINFDWDEIKKRAIALVNSYTPIIFYGPPGTGKSRMIDEIKKVLESEGKIGSFEIVQFHRKYSYEDFIEGFSPNGTGGFDKRDGVFKSFCKKCVTSKINIFVIDEMNRADISGVFGEMLFLIEDRNFRKAKTSHFGDEFSIPENVSLMGTMNTADRNIALVDYALRRRFVFLPLYPDAKQLKGWLNNVGFNGGSLGIEEYVKAFEVINERIKISPLLGAHMRLGQSLFVPRGVQKNISTIDLINNLTEVILPQAESYLGFGNSKEMELIFNSSIVLKYLSGKKILEEDFLAFVRELNTDESAK